LSFYVVIEDSPPLLDLVGCRSLDIVRRAGTFDTVIKDNTLSEFSYVFCGIVSMPGEYHIVGGESITAVVYLVTSVPLQLKRN